MIIARTRKDLIKTLQQFSLKPGKLALIPTMGNLHNGHLSLIRLAKLNAEKTITTIFVEADKIANAVELLNVFNSHFPDRIESFELMPKVFWEVAKNNIENIKLPFEDLPEMGVLIDISSFSKTFLGAS